jgi:universal stress protein A
MIQSRKPGSRNPRTEEQLMTHFRKILVPIDFSSHSRVALDLAVKMARDGGAILQLLHCYQIQAGGISPYGVALPSDYFSMLRDAAARKLNQWKQEFVPSDVKSEETLCSDHPSAAIVTTAERTGADLIVMGTRGLSGIKHVLLGSTAERTVRNAPCPVLTVKVRETTSQS